MSLATRMTLALGGMLMAGLAQAATVTVSTVPGWGGTLAISPWGHGFATETYGQTITAPAGTSSLDSFSFLLQDVNDSLGIGSPGPIKYQANVYQWDSVNNHPVGSPIYQSGVLTTPVTNTGAFLTTTFTTGGAPVTPGAQYIAFLTTNGIPGATDGNTTWADEFTDLYAGGAFWFLNDSVLGDLFTNSWSNSAAFGSGAGDDVIFSATFSVPEPISMTVFGAALAGLALTRGRRDASRAAR